MKLTTVLAFALAVAAFYAKVKFGAFGFSEGW